MRNSRLVWNYEIWKSRTFDNKIKAVKEVMQLQAYRGPDANGII